MSPGLLAGGGQESGTVSTSSPDLFPVKDDESPPQLQAGASDSGHFSPPPPAAREPSWPHAAPYSRLSITPPASLASLHAPQIRTWSREVRRPRCWGGGPVEGLSRGVPRERRADPLKGSQPRALARSSGLPAGLPHLGRGTRAAPLSSPLFPAVSSRLSPRQGKGSGRTLSCDVGLEPKRTGALPWEC